MAFLWHLGNSPLEDINTPALVSTARALPCVCAQVVCRAVVRDFMQAVGSSRDRELLHDAASESAMKFMQLLFRWRDKELLDADGGGLTPFLASLVITCFLFSDATPSNGCLRQLAVQLVCAAPTLLGCLLPKDQAISGQGLLSELSWLAVMPGVIQRFRRLLDPRQPHWPSAMQSPLPIFPQMSVSFCIAFAEPSQHRLLVSSGRSQRLAGLCLYCLLLHYVESCQATGAHALDTAELVRIQAGVQASIRLLGPRLPPSYWDHHALLDDLQRLDPSCYWSLRSFDRKS